ncbi:hypothetical protein D9611_010140 [Ephemerocybe angulata]|uniref:BTB domain-containing protein n=1 Tax=Ephemerocybe angulata TaxID=980116 RepID=A0A8H5B0B2_9AGAR|nr:hypothetical protein D9611_010140 [Tulosesus angulatus]
MATPTQSSSPTMPTRDPYSYWEKFVFQVEDTLFRIPRRGLDKASNDFADKFRPQTAVEGQSDDNDNQIIIEGCKSSEFEGLLKCMYPVLVKVKHLPGNSKPAVTLSGTTTLSKDEWLDIFKLSTTCTMDDVRFVNIRWSGRRPDAEKDNLTSLFHF